jgi:hypothetical protein
MRSVKRLGTVMGMAVAAIVVSATAASAVTVLGTTANPCPSGYYGVVAGSGATGEVYVCENVA